MTKTWRVNLKKSGLRYRKYFCFWVQSKVAPMRFFMLIRLIYENLVSKVRKKLKSSRWKSYFGWKNRNLILFSSKKMCSCATGGYFFLGTFKRCAKKRFLISVSIRYETQALESRENWKTNIWNLCLYKKAKKILQKVRVRALRGNLFMGSTERCAKKSYLSWSEL